MAIPSDVQWILGFGISPVVVIVLLLSDRLRIGSQVDKQLADKDKQLADKDKQCEEWKKIAQDGIESARRIADAIGVIHDRQNR